MKKFFWKYWLLSVVLIMAAALRLYELGSLPTGLTWDEAAIGYNGYAVSKTGRDEWLIKLPISFKSFSDYKAPVAIYVTSIFAYFFGITPFLVRLPFALSGILAVLGMYWLVLLLFKNFKHHKWLALFMAFLIAVSPWHLHFTRVGFESGMALTAMIIGLVLLTFFLQELEKKTKWYWILLVGIGAGFFLVLSLYTYHSAKIVVPLVSLLTVACFVNFKAAIKKWWLILILVVLAGLGSWPLLADTLYGSGGARASVLIFSEPHSIGEYSRIIANNYLAHLAPSFLVQGAADSFRHSTQAWGVLYVTTYLLAIAGFVTMLLSLGRKYSDKSKIGIWAVVSIIIGLLPAVISFEVPHPNRTLLALPGFFVLAVLGLESVVQYLATMRSFKQYNLDKAFIGTLVLVHVFLFLGYWQYYTQVYPYYSSSAFIEGYVEAMTLAKEYEKGENGKPEVEKILFSSEYGQPYIYALFVRKTNPYWYHGGSLIKYIFTDTIKESDLAQKNTLVVATKSNLLPLERAEHVVYARDGSVQFAFYLTETE